MARTPGVRAVPGGVHDGLRRVLAVDIWQVGRSGRANPRAVLRRVILSPADGPGRIGRFMFAR